MSFERVSAGTAIGAEPAPSMSPTTTAAADGPSPSLRLQILSTEHWSLLASRSLAWNETFSRAGMFLSTLSGAMVALALVAQASAFGEGFTLFALVILPIVLFIGVTTLIRLRVSNYHDAMCVVGMNRIRAAYLEFAPDLERYFVMSAHDDFRGIGITMAARPGGDAIPLWYLLAATPMLISVLNSAIAGVIVALAALRLGVDTWAALGVGMFGFVLAMALHGWYERKSIASLRAGYRPLFPSPEGKE
jgi:hypothetical protein